MTFCTSIHCIDGRIQEPLIKHLKAKYGISYVDTITEPGPCKILAENVDKVSVASIMKRVEISAKMHDSKLIAVSGHYDCTGNPGDDALQKKQIEESISYLKRKFPALKIVGLWINSEWIVNIV